MTSLAALMNAMPQPAVVMAPAPSETPRDTTPITKTMLDHLWRIDPEMDRSEGIWAAVKEYRKHSFSVQDVFEKFKQHPNSTISQKHAGNDAALLKDIERAYGKPPSSDPRDEFQPTPLDLTTGSHADIARVLRAEIEAAYGPVFYDEGNLYRYDGKQHTPVPNTEIQARLLKFDGRKYGTKGSVSLTKGTMASITSMLVTLTARPGFFAAALTCVPCNNGVIIFANDGTPSLVAHSPEHGNRHFISAEWLPGVVSHREGSLLSKLLGGCFLGDTDADDKIAVIGEILGAAISGYATKLLKPLAWILHGMSAENGKSELQQMMRAMVPANASTTLPPGKFGDPTFVVRLIGSLLNASDELSGAHAIAGDAFKSIVTGNPLAARDLYCGAVSFSPKAQHVYATNQLPTFDSGMDRGVRRRLGVLTFNRTIPKAERVVGIGTLVATQETGLLLAFAVEGAARLIKQRHFSEPESSKLALRNWIFNADPVLAWFDENGNFSQGERTKTRDAYQHFKYWAAAEGFNVQKLPQVQNFAARIVAHDSRVTAKRNHTEGYFLNNLTLGSACLAPHDLRVETAPPAIGAPGQIFGEHT